MDKCYVCIDLKSFYASVECVKRGLDPLTTDLVVADEERGKGSICLAVSPSLKAKGVRNRCRLFEVPTDLKVIIAKPKMQDYIKESARIYKIYLKYFSPDDILVYSIDECFIDVTLYLKLYKKTPLELVKMITSDILEETKLTVSVGIGPNMFLAKVAMDIIAKKNDDHIGILDLESFKKEIQPHMPITDIWNIGPGIAKRLAKYGVFTLGEVAEMDESVLYKEFGVNALFLIDHSHGIEPCTIKEVHNYKPEVNSLSNSQILFSDYSYNDALLVFKEMIEINCLDLVDKGLVTNQLFYSVGYSKDVIKPTGASLKLLGFTDSYQKIKDYFLESFVKTTDKTTPIRRISIGFGNVKPGDFIEYDLFDDKEQLKNEKNLQKTIISIKKKYGKNAIIKGMDLEEKATTRQRNKLIGGHNG